MTGQCASIKMDAGTLTPVDANTGPDASDDASTDASDG